LIFNTKSLGSFFKFFTFKIDKNIQWQSGERIWDCSQVLGNVYVGAEMSDKSDDKSEVPWFSNGSSLLSPLLSLIAAPT
jgi:hypothetical protein